MQWDKEEFAIVVGFKHFHPYIYRRTFTCVTDHKPLLGILHEAKVVPQMVSPRVWGWSLTFATYDYRLQYKDGNQNQNSDAMNRLPLKTKDQLSPIPGDVVLLMDHLSTNSVVTAYIIKIWTLRDPVSAKVYHFIRTGCSDIVNVSLDKKSYVQRRDELSSEAGCVLWGS